MVPDEPGTLRGVWYQPGSDAVIGWDGQLAFVTDNYDPAIAVIAAGGAFTERGRVEFTPTTSGTTNRVFRDVTADGTLYRYERDGSGRRERVQNPDLLSGKILVQLASATELQIERQSGRCDVADAFSAPKKSRSRRCSFASRSASAGAGGRSMPTAWARRIGSWRSTAGSPVVGGEDERAEPHACSSSRDLEGLTMSVRPASG